MLPSLAQLVPARIDTDFTDVVDVIADVKIRDVLVQLDKVISEPDAHDTLRLAVRLINELCSFLPEFEAYGMLETDALRQVEEALLSRREKIENLKTPIEYLRALRFEERPLAFLFKLNRSPIQRMSDVDVRLWVTSVCERTKRLDTVLSEPPPPRPRLRDRRNGLLGLF